jgi:hypothetical protein
MFGRYFLLLVAIGYVNSLQTSVIRHLLHLSTQNNGSVGMEEGDLSKKGEHKSSRGSYFTAARPPQNYVVNQAPGPQTDVEEGNYFEGDIMLRPDQQLSSVSIFHAANEK